VVVLTEWETLPLSRLHKLSLKEALEDLPFSLDAAAAAIDDEVVRFTQNNGWQKMDNLLPLLYRSKGWFCDTFDDWTAHLDRFTEEMKVSSCPLF
jgi:hypothetical protein